MRWDGLLCIYFEIMSKFQKYSSVSISKNASILRQRRASLKAGLIPELQITDRNGFRKRQPPTPNSHVYAVIALMFTVFIAVIVLEKKLPTGLKIASENNPKLNERFIAERAMKLLKNLTSIGPRPSGSFENEILAVNFFKLEINRIVSQASDMHMIDVDYQKSSGAFKLEFLDGMTNVYNDVQSVVVRVGSKIKSKHSLLINCHFDTVQDSPGASDDGAGCAVMLEILRVLTRSHKILKYNLIFLFNGAEENIMQGSHGFITQHRWAKEVRAFINLEACGAGGRELLFQAGPNNPWLLETYSQEVPYPYASSMAQEIFQSGIIPGDTDFRIFRDFGKVSGVDFAWSSNGYVYHTKFDTVDQIPLGSLQRTGDNILALVKGIAAGHQLSDVNQFKSGNLVFFDFLGAMVVRWPESVAAILNFVVTVVSLYSVYINSKWAKKNGTTPSVYLREVWHSAGYQIIAWIVALASCVIISLVLTLLDRTMSWYSKPIWIVFLYILPTLGVSMTVIYYFGKKQKQNINSYWVLYQIHYDAAQIMWTLLLVLTTILKIRSGFISLLWVMFAAIGNLLQQAIYKHNRDWKWLILHCFLIGIPFIQTFYLNLGAIYMFIPIMGRIGSTFNSEIIVAIMICVFFGIMFSFVTQLILLAENPDLIISLPIGLSFFAIALILLTPLGFPYSGESNALAPQRFIISHVERITYDYSMREKERDYGYWFMDMDINSLRSVDKIVPELSSAVRVDCKKELYCGMPYLLPVMNFIKKTHWMPAPAYNIATRTHLKLNKKELLARNTVRFNFTVSGPDHMALMFSPFLNYKLLRWSIDAEEPLKAYDNFGRDSYFVYYSYSSAPKDWNFSLDFSVPETYNQAVDKIMDLSINGHYIHGKYKASKDLVRLVHKFPAWTAVSYWTSSIKSFVF